MKVMVIGSGGREHAISWKLAQVADRKVFVSPGNAGMAYDKNLHCTGIAASDFEGILAFCEKEKVEFVVVGPDQQLADGLVDFLEARGIPAFGPTKSAAQVEASKAFSKSLMKEAGIPTAKFEVFSSAGEATIFLQEVEWGNGWVVKADGLALGKGVVVCETREQAIDTVKDFMEAGAMGAAGAKIVIEERLHGREVSAFSLCDGDRAVFLGFSCDYKRLKDGGLGPNTGGMGSFTPADWIEEDIPDRVQKEIVLPLLAAMKKKGAAYKGILYSGLMITSSGPKVIEFNARFGDPETQSLLPMIEEDLLPWFIAAREGKLDSLPEAGPERKILHAVHVVMAAHGYPGTGGEVVRKGDAISIPAVLLEENAQRKVFFAGVAKQGNGLVTNGGRVLGVTAWAATQAVAKKIAYAILEEIKFNGSQKRGDIGDE